MPPPPPPLPTALSTPRLELRRWTERDAAELRRVLDACDAHLRPWIPFMQHEPRSLAATRAWLAEIAAQFAAGELFRYAVRERQGSALVGETMLLRRGGPRTLEAGYWLHRDRCGNGYATEATAALLPHAFGALGAERVILRCDERNAASLRVARRLGAEPVDVEAVHEQGRDVRLVVLAIPAPR